MFVNGRIKEIRHAVETRGSLAFGYMGKRGSETHLKEIFGLELKKNSRDYVLQDTFLGLVPLC